MCQNSLEYIKVKKNIQDAHEAIRPSYIEITPEIAKGSLTPEQYKLYSLIWKRFGKPNVFMWINTNSIDIMNGSYKFKASGNTIKIWWFYEDYDYLTEADEEDVVLPGITRKGRIKTCSV